MIPTSCRSESDKFKFALYWCSTCRWSAENTGSSTLLAITRSTGARSQPSSWDLMGRAWVEVVGSGVVVVEVVVLGWNSSLQPWIINCIR